MKMLVEIEVTTQSVAARTEQALGSLLEQLDGAALAGIRTLLPTTDVARMGAEAKWAACDDRTAATAPARSAAVFITGDDVRFYPGWLDQAIAAAGDRYDVVGTNDVRWNVRPNGVRGATSVR